MYVYAACDGSSVSIRYHAVATVESIENSIKTIEFLRQKPLQICIQWKNTWLGKKKPTKAHQQTFSFNK
jgi:hypothetical protein